MYCGNKTIFIVILGLIALFLFLTNINEKFNYQEYKKKIETKPLEANVIDRSV